MQTELISPWFLGLAIMVALAAGVTGSFALMKGITLAGDVISHIALPGIGIALLLRIHPLIGGAATLFLGTLLIARLEARSGLATETTIGVVFVASLALGALLTPGKDLEEALFGNPTAVSVPEFAAGFIAALLVVAVLWSMRHQLILHLFSPELAASLGVNGQRLNLLFLMLFSLTVLLELTFLGALLASALIMIPPALARHLTHRLVFFIGISAITSACSMAGGIAIAAWRGLPLGPAVAAVASLFFVCSLLVAER